MGPAGTTKGPRTVAITYKPVAVVTLLHSADGNSWALRVRFLDFNDEIRTLDIPWPAIQTRDVETVRTMTHAGMPLISGEAPALFRFFSAAPTNPDLPRILTVANMGFCHGWDKSQPDRLAFALPSGCLVAAPAAAPAEPDDAPTADLEARHVHPGLQVMADIPPEYLEPYHPGSTLPEWQELALLAKGDFLLTFFLSAAFAAPLLQMAGGENAFLHVFGTSSRGKTTAAQLAGSVMGRAGDPQGSTQPTVVARWHSTANGLELVYASRSGVGLITDELGNLTSALDLYAAAGGMSKVRMSRELGFQPSRRWSLLGISTGELSMAEAMQELGKRKPKIGERVRGIDIPAQPLLVRAGLSDDEAAARAKLIKRWAAERYGVAGPVFAQQLLNRHATLPELRAVVSELVDDIHPRLIEVLERAGHQLRPAERRVLRQFSLVMAAGWLAIETGVLPLAENDVSEAVEAAATAWLSASTYMDEEKSAVDAVRHYVLQHQGEIFNVDDGVDSVPPRQTYGLLYRDLILLDEQQFEEACAGLNTFHAKQALRAAGILKTEGDKLGLRVSISRLGIKGARFFAIRLRKLFEDSSIPLPTFTRADDQGGNSAQPTS